MPKHDRIVAVGLLTQSDLNLLGQGFRRAYHLEEHHDFDDLLRAIDQAEREYRDGQEPPTAAQDQRMPNVQPRPQKPE